MQSKEYKSCTYYIDENNRAVVTVIGSNNGKFSGLRAIENSTLVALMILYTY